MCRTGDDFCSTASLVEAVLMLQEQQDQRSLANVMPPPTAGLPGSSHVESAATEPRVSVMGTDRQLDTSISTATAAAASVPADVNGEYFELYLSSC